LIAIISARIDTSFIIHMFSDSGKFHKKSFSILVIYYTFPNYAECHNNDSTVYYSYTDIV
jgi:hypothetical protein